MKLDWKEQRKNVPTQEATGSIPAEGFPHYCPPPADCWCSAKLPGGNYPEDCISHRCEYYHASPDAPQTTNEVQGELTLAP